MIVVLEDLSDNDTEYLGSDSEEILEIVQVGIGPQGPKGSGGIETVAGVAPVGDDVPAADLRGTLGIDALATELQSETSARTAMDVELDDAITAVEVDILAESVNRQNAIDGVGAAINAEVQARTDADADIVSGLNAETIARTTADSTLQTNINNEAAARAAADAALDARVDVIEATDYDEEGSAAAVQAELDAHEAQTTGAHNLAALLGAKADLVGGKIPSDQIPSIAIIDTFPVEDQAEMLALTAERGDVAVRADTGRAYILRVEPAATLANWVELSAPGVITSVNGQTGVVVLTAANVGADPAGSAQEVADDLTAEVAARIAADESLQNQIDNIEAGGSANIATIVNLVAGPRVIISATEPIDPEPGDYWFESLDAMITSFSQVGPKGDDGDAGDSAYAVAVANGFVGTEADWLASLEGDSGSDGVSAYQVAVDNGFVGSESDWLASLEGEPCDSAYEVAVANGFVGTEADWLDSLQGEPGTSDIATIVNDVEGPRIVISATEPTDPGAGDYWFPTLDDMIDAFTAGGVVESVNGQIGVVDLDAADVGARPVGDIPIADIDATGTPDSTTYLRGDGAWAVPEGGGASAFADLTDVDWTTPPTEGQVFAWDEVTSKIVPVDPSTGGGGDGGGPVGYSLFLYDDFNRTDALVLGDATYAAFPEDITYPNNGAGISSNALYYPAGAGTLLVETRSPLQEVELVTSTAGGSGIGAIILNADLDDPMAPAYGYEPAGHLIFEVTGLGPTPTFLDGTPPVAGDKIKVKVVEDEGALRMEVTINDVAQTVSSGPIPAFTTFLNYTGLFVALDELNAHIDTLSIRTVDLIPPTGGGGGGGGTVDTVVAGPGIDVDATDPANPVVSMEADLSVTGKGFIAHGATAGTARPTGFASVEWFGTVEPDNWIDGDTWIDPTEA